VEQVILIHTGNALKLGWEERTLDATSAKIEIKIESSNRL
jgi:hypothetical protein